LPLVLRAFCRWVRGRSADRYLAIRTGRRWNAAASASRCAYRQRRSRCRQAGRSAGQDTGREGRTGLFRRPFP